MNIIPDFFELQKNNIEHEIIVGTMQDTEFIISLARVCNGQIEKYLRFHNLLFYTDSEIINSPVVNNNNCFIYSDFRPIVDEVFYITEKMFNLLSPNIEILDLNKTKTLKTWSKSRSITDSKGKIFTFTPLVLIELDEELTTDSNPLWDFCLDYVTYRYIDKLGISKIQNLFLDMTKYETVFIILN